MRSPSFRAAALCLAATASQAAPIVVVPAGLAPGTQYRLAFVTSTTRNGSSTVQADYNNHVQTAANSVSQLAQFSWAAVASTPAFSASSLNTSGPVYNLGGLAVIGGGQDLFTIPLWLNAINVTEQGNIYGGQVYTGTLTNGAGFPGGTLGSSQVMTGSASSTTGLQIQNGLLPSGTALPLYAITTQLLIVGGSQLTPVLPGSGDIIVGPDGQLTYRFTDVPGGFWYDPPGTVGFEYTGVAGTLFTSIELPTGFASNFTITYGPAFGSTLGSFGAGPVNFVALAGGALGAFRITGLNPTVDSDNPAAFPLKINFSDEVGSFSMTGLSGVPEPGTWVMLATGLGVMALRRRKQ